jgi:flagellar biosynthesis protein FlhB
LAEESDNSDKTEEPSQYRIEEFRKKGQVASSKDLASVAILFAATLTLLLSVFYIYETVKEFIQWLYAIDFSVAYGEKVLKEIFQKSALLLFKCIAPTLLVCMITGVLIQIAQVGFIFSPEVLTVKFDKINPLNGFKRLFSAKSIVEMVKGILKFTFIIFITYTFFKSKIFYVIDFLNLDTINSVIISKELVTEISMYIILSLLFVAMIDFTWEKYSYHQKLKQTKQEQKEEQKKYETNPEVKQKIRSIQRQIATKRVATDVPKADVIVTNPTHLSIAIKFDSEKMIAPIVLAKGKDFLALKIRELAKNNDVPIVENISLARTLYKTVDVGEAVPRSLYKAIAEILAFVFKLKRKKKALDIGR